MDTTQLLIDAMQRHVTVLEKGTINIPHWTSIVIDEDIPVVITPYSVDAATVEAAFLNSFLINKGATEYSADSIPAGEYTFIDPSDAYFKTADEKRAWPLTLRDVQKAEFHDRADGGTSVMIPFISRVTHHDAESNHVAQKNITLIDALIYRAAHDARLSGRTDEYQNLLSLAAPYYGSHLTKEQELEIFKKLRTIKPIVVRATREFTASMAASTRRNTRTYSDEDMSTPIMYTPIGARKIKKAIMDKERGEAKEELLSVRLINNENAVIKNRAVPFIANSATMKLFRILDGEYMARGGRPDRNGRAVVTTSTSRVCELMGRKEDKEARRSIRKQFQNLWGCLRYAYIDDTGAVREAVNGVEYINTWSNSNLTITFTSEFTKAFWGTNAPMQADDPVIYTTDDQKNPLAFPIACRMIDNVTQNTGTPQEYRLGVTSMLDFLQGIPSHDSIKNRAWKKRRIEPLQRDLDHLVEIGFLKEWHFCHKNGAELEADELDSDGLLNYDTVIRAMSSGRDDTFIAWTPVHVYKDHLLQRQEAKAKKREERELKAAKAEERKAERRRNREDLIDRKVAEKIAESETEKLL